LRTTSSQPAARSKNKIRHLAALAQRVEVIAEELRIMGSKSELLRTLVAASSAKIAGFGVPSFVPKWRARRDSNS
jgi:site-specific DNA recombinase